MKLTDLEKYKHDTIGKFVILKEMIESLDEENLNTAESLEIIEASDEVFQGMLNTSKSLIKKLKS